jgi:YHS domain-containing protein
MTIKPILFIATLGLAFGSSAARADETKPPTKAQAIQTESAKPKAYPLDTCLVSDEKFDPEEKPYIFVHDGQEIKLCCKKCLKKFNHDPANYMKKIHVVQPTQAKEKKEVKP